MRVIICGGGQVGFHIAAYLARENNDITLIDIDPHVIARINSELDVNGICGNACHPEIQERAGAEDADMIIAVTRMDEVNMVACQVGHSLFSIPKKVARLRDRAFLDSAWSNLFSRTHMPIDVIVSPEVEVAKAVEQRLRIPGTTNVMSLAEDKVHLVGVICEENCPLVNTQLKQIGELFPQLPMRIALIIRGAEHIFPQDDDQLEIGDEAYFFTDTKHLKRSLSAFGHEETEAHNIVIFGGGNVGTYVTEFIQKYDRRAKIKIIERDFARATFLSETLQDVIVLHGDGLQAELLQEADISSVETLVAVTDDDETNILGSLLAKQHGCERVITLVNKPSYNDLVTPLGVDAVVSPRALTISTIMESIRRGRIKELHSLRDGSAEVFEVEISEISPVIGVALSDLSLPANTLIGAVVRDDKVLMPDTNFIIQKEDHLVILADAQHMNEIEQIFTVRVDLF